MGERALTFSCSGAMLVGVVHEPDAAVADVAVLIVVGGPQYRVGSHRQFVLMARDLAAAGYPVLRFDYRGMGDSDGASRNFENVQEDIRAALDVLFAECPGIRKAVVWGLCDAASAALMYCCNDARVKGLVLANPWVRTQQGEAKTYLRHYYLKRLLQRSFWVKVFTLQFGAWRSARELAAAVKLAAADREDNSTSYIDRMRSGLAKFTGSTLLLLSGRDLTAREFSDLCAAEPRWGALVNGARVMTAQFDSADHTFSDRSSLRAATDRTLTWLSALARADAHVAGG